MRMAELLGKSILFNGNSYLIENGDYQEPNRPYSFRDKYLQGRRRVRRYFAERRGDKAGYDKAETFLDPHGNDHSKESVDEHTFLFS